MENLLEVNINNFEKEIDRKIKMIQHSYDMLNHKDSSFGNAHITMIKLYKDVKKIIVKYKEFEGFKI